jgi:putative phage-type endonuclease
MAIAEKPYRLLDCPPAGSEEWLEFRKNGLGGSDVAAIVDSEFPYGSPLTVWMDKMGLSEPKPMNTAMMAGVAMEPVIIHLYEIETGLTGEKPVQMYQDKERPILLANLDWISSDGTRGMDAKRSNAPKMWGENGSDAVPMHYFYQCQHYMGITGAKQWDIAVLLPYDELRIYPILRDDDVIADMRRKCLAFWSDYVVTGEKPPIDTVSEANLDIVKRNTTVREGKTVELHEGTTLVIERYNEIGDEIKKLKAEQDGLKAILLDRMGDADRGNVLDLYSLKRTLVSPKPYTAAPKPYIKLTITEVKNK